MIVPRENHITTQKRYKYQRLFRKQQLQQIFRGIRKNFSNQYKFVFHQPNRNNYIKQEEKRYQNVQNQNYQLHYPISNVQCNINFNPHEQNNNSSPFNVQCNNYYMNHSNNQYPMYPCIYNQYYNLQQQQFINNQRRNATLLYLQHYLKEKEDTLTNKKANSLTAKEQEPLNSKCPDKIIQEYQYGIYDETAQYIVFDKFLGQGTYSTVRLGLNKRKNERVAIKIINKRQENEIQDAFRINHPNIIQLFAVWTKRDNLYIALQLCERNIKEDLIQSNYNEGLKLRYISSLIKAMDVLFKNHIIHRDLKAQNILIKNKEIKVADFGLAKNMNNMVEIESMRCGTPYTMAPEIYFSLQETVTYSQKSDIWSLGVIMHEILYKVHPFNCDKACFQMMKRVWVKKEYQEYDQIIDGCLKTLEKRINWAKIIYLHSEYQKRISVEQQMQVQHNDKSMSMSMAQDYQYLLQEQKEIKFRNNYYFCEEKQVNYNRNIKKVYQIYNDIQSPKIIRAKRQANTPIITKQIIRQQKVLNTRKKLKKLSTFQQLLTEKKDQKTYSYSKQKIVPQGNNLMTEYSRLRSIKKFMKEQIGWSEVIFMCICAGLVVKYMLIL